MGSECLLRVELSFFLSKCLTHGVNILPVAGSAVAEQHAPSRGTFAADRPARPPARNELPLSIVVLECHAKCLAGVCSHFAHRSGIFSKKKRHFAAAFFKMARCQSVAFKKPLFSTASRTTCEMNGKNKNRFIKTDEARE